MTTTSIETACFARTFMETTGLESTTALTICVHLEDGRIAQFVQPDAELARQVLLRIQPGRLFTAESLIIGGDQATVAFQTSMVARVDLVTELPINWPYHNNIVDATEITREEFQQRYRLEDYRSGMPEWMPSFNKVMPLFAEFELVNGEQFYMAVRARQFRRIPLEESIALHRLFTSGGLHAHLRNGGVTIINPACIVRVALYPGAEKALPGIWQATYVGV